MLRAKPEDYHALRVSSMIRILSKFGFNVEYDRLYEIYRDVRRFCNLYRKKTLVECPGIQEVGEICSRLNISVSGYMLDALLRAYMEPFRRYIMLREDVPEVLRMLRDDGLKIGIISNSLSGYYARLNLARDGVLKYFDVTAFSDEVGFRKPHPEIFLYALSKVGLSPREAVMVGDDPETDVVGAKSIGMWSIIISYDPNGADFMIKNLSELRNVLGRLRR